ncbi:MAG: DNA-directed RNA polymerase subunit beta' [Elusimicrobia bacterium]|nr:DNA-directed RNA polymerase subunit beta' [Elusimicrobiota bacterium]
MAQTTTRLEETTRELLFSARKKKKKAGDFFNFMDFDAIRLTVASPDRIKSWSYGEVRKPETINYRTLKPERDGLFCERIFGPSRDYECACGKYKWVKFRGIVCDRCGVEVTEAKVRRERMGHIDLVVPVAHIWFLRKPPSRIAIALDMKLGDLMRTVYYKEDGYLVLENLEQNGKVVFRRGDIIDIDEYQKAKAEFGGRFKCSIGGGAVQDMLAGLELKEETQLVRKKLQKLEAEGERNRLIKRLRILEGFLHSESRPEWMMLTTLPVIPPDLRPLVPLEGGRFATSDLNDLYRKIINRNNRLKHIEQLRAPEVMIHNEKRLLQDSVDALIENGAGWKVSLGPGNRPLKSLSDIIKGKEGRFRQNLLGKRVDYSGRSVVVVGPKLKLHQCGLPKEMALELFKPFLLGELIKRHSVTLKAARKMLEKATAEVWDILADLTKDHLVLLNRAPTLHRLSIQAFEPVLVEGKAIQLHPLTCPAFNADFDGDQMAVHVPLSYESLMEARLLMLSSRNIFSPASGRPIAQPSQDVILGLCYLTKPKAGVMGEGRCYSSVDEVIAAFQRGFTLPNAKIKIMGFNKLDEEQLALEQKMDPKLWKDWTTVGRAIFNAVIPKEMGYVNQTIDKKTLGGIILECYRTLGHYRTVQLLDEAKNLGYRYSTYYGVSISISDMLVPKVKKEIVRRAQDKVKEIERQSKAGAITEMERYNKVVDIWTHATDQVADNMFAEMQSREKMSPQETGSLFNSIFIMADSGARGSRAQVRQLGGMRGLMAKPQKKIMGQYGEIIETPVISNFREGLSVLEYFISTHGGRKGLADTALKTADAGYLTRRLVDVTHDVVVVEEDCGTINGIRIAPLYSGEEVIESLEERIAGRVVLEDVRLAGEGVSRLRGQTSKEKEEKEKILAKAGELIDWAKARAIAKSDVPFVRVRSTLTCEAKYGVCAKCFGLSLATGQMVEAGEAVGIIAAQSIGEPGTQLTLRTFHIGGTAARVVSKSQAVSAAAGTVVFKNIELLKRKSGEVLVHSRNSEIAVFDPETKTEKESHRVPHGARLKVKNSEKAPAGTLLAEWDPYALPIMSKVEGQVRYEDIEEGITTHEEKNKITGLTERRIIEHREQRKRPRIIVADHKGKELDAYTLPVDTIIVTADGEPVGPGDILAKIPLEVSITRDITGGLPRVSELFEARRPKNSTVISEIDGVVSLGTTAKGGQKVIVRNEETDVVCEYSIPQGKHLMVYEGDRVGVGEALTDGPINPHDILRVKGLKECQEYLVCAIQEVYRLQGVMVNDKHIELIVREMLENVRITKAGATHLLVGEIVNRFEFEEENEQAIKAKREPAEAQVVLLGITKAALSSRSFISAASFQETTRVLTDAAVSGKLDFLRGLKENVIIGRLIPAGTGLAARQQAALEHK